MGRGDWVLLTLQTITAPILLVILTCTAVKLWQMGRKTGFRGLGGPDA